MANLYKPQPYQLEFHRSPATFRLLLGGRQSGKTFAGRVEALIQAERNPGSEGYVFAPTYQKLKDLIIDKLLSSVNPSVIQKFSWQDKALIFKPFKGTNKQSIIKFRSADNPEEGRGITPDWIWLDEAREMSEYFWHVLNPSRITTKAPVYITTTPNGKDWVYRNFLRPALDDPTQIKYRYWQFKSEDNIYADKEEIELAKQYMPDWLYRQEYEASIEEHTGLIYHGFKHKTHVINEEFITPQPTWRYFLGIDVGFHNPTAILLVAEDQDRNLWVLDEVYEVRLMPEQIVNAARKMLSDWKISESALVAKVIDPASASTDQTSGDSVQAIMADTPFNFSTEPARNEVLPGIIRVQQYLKVHPETNEPMMHISSKCRNLIREFEEYIWQPQRETTEKNAKDAPRKYNDHALDTLRYICMTRPDLGPLAVQDPWSGEVYYNNEDMEKEYIRRQEGQSGPYFDVSDPGTIEL